MLEIMFFSLIGLLLGTLTGLIPGLHINTINQLLMSVNFENITGLIIVIVSLSLTHTFLDSIPSILVGVPDSSAIVTLPGHKMVKEGRGKLAIKYTLIGSFFAVFFIAILSPILFNFVRVFYVFSKNYVVFILIFFILLNINLSKNKWLTLLIIILAGSLGEISLRFENAMFPMLTGLFGLSSLFVSTNSMIPEQIDEKVDINNKKLLKNSFLSIFSGTLTGTLPGISSSHASVIAMLFNKDEEERNLEDYLVIVGGINTVNFLISIFVLYLFDKARNGSIITIQTLTSFIDFGDVIFLMSLSLFISGIAYFWGSFLSGMFIKVIRKLNYKILCYILICFLIVLVFLFTSYLGLFILFCSTFLGIITIRLRVERRSLMACILIPVLLFFLG